VPGFKADRQRIHIFVLIGMEATFKRQWTWQFDYLAKYPGEGPDSHITTLVLVL
jgi:hypothetical protein